MVGFIDREREREEKRKTNGIEVLKVYWYLDLLEIPG